MHPAGTGALVTVNETRDDIRRRAPPMTDEIRRVLALIDWYGGNMRTIHDINKTDRGAGFSAGYWYKLRQLHPWLADYQQAAKREAAAEALTIQKQRMAAAIELADGKISAAARQLGISAATLEAMIANHPDLLDVRARVDARRAAEAAALADGAMARLAAILASREAADRDAISAARVALDYHIKQRPQQIAVTAGISGELAELLDATGATMDDIVAALAALTDGQ